MIWEIKSYLITRKFVSELFSGKEWFKNGIKRIENRLKEKGGCLPFPCFQRDSLKKTSFLYYYQVISVISGHDHLLTNAKFTDLSSESVSHEDLESFLLTAG